jgi:hypothetical protein
MDVLMFIWCAHCLAQATDPHCVSNCVSVCSLLLELAWKDAAGKLEGAGEGIQSAVHLCDLRHVADEPVESDVPANKRDRTSKMQAAAEEIGQRRTARAMSVSA